jgi:hypothetical protein
MATAKLLTAVYSPVCNEDSEHVTAMVTPHHPEQPLLEPAVDEFLEPGKKPTSFTHTDAKETAAAAAVRTTLPCSRCQDDSAIGQSTPGFYNCRSLGEDWK